MGMKMMKVSPPEFRGEDGTMVKGQYRTDTYIFTGVP